MSLKRQLLPAIYRAIYLSGKVAHDGGITILSYHSLDDYNTPLSVSPRLFSAQMAAIASEGCPTFTMGRVAQYLVAKVPFPPRAVAITFDDGFANLATVGAPVMARYGFTGTVYIITGMVGRTTHWTDRGVALPPVPLLSWRQIEEAQQSGIEIGAHSVTHGFLTQYTSSELEHELCHSKAQLEQMLGLPVSAFAYPQGDYNNSVVAATRAAGYLTATTVDQGRTHLRSHPLRLPRLLVSGNTSPAALRAFTAPTIGPAYHLVNLAFRRLLGRKNWPRRSPGEVQSTDVLAETGAL